MEGLFFPPLLHPVASWVTQNWTSSFTIFPLLIKELVITVFLAEKARFDVIQDLPDKYTAMIELLDSGTVVKMDQVHVETVLPAIGKTVMVLNGPYCGEEATLLGINEDRFSATIKLNTVSRAHV